MDGGDGGFVHPLRGHFEAVGAGQPGIRGIVVTQLGQQRIGLGQIAAEEACGLGQAGSDPLAQLLGGRIGEGHHEDLRRQQFPTEALLATMAEHQAQVQRGDGEGLAGTGTGLDQLAAVQREGQRQGDLLDGLAHGRASSLASVCHGASNMGLYRASHQPSNSSLAVSAAKSLNCRARATLSLRSPSRWPSPS